MLALIFLGSVVCFGLIEAQQSNNLSPWAVMLILAYPFTDLIFSVLREEGLLQDGECDAA